MKTRRKLSLGLLVLLVLAFPMSVAGDDEGENCQYEGTNTPTYVPGYGWACAGWGIGCTECVNSSTGRYCVRNGNHPCVPEAVPPTP
jgi:hypothetical protein